MREEEEKGEWTRMVHESEGCKNVDDEDDGEAKGMETQTISPSLFSIHPYDALHCVNVIINIVTAMSFFFAMCYFFEKN